MKIKQYNYLFVLLFSLFLVACGKSNDELQVFSFPLSNGEVSVKNFTIISSKDQIYIEDNYYFSFQDEMITDIGIDIFDNNHNFVYSFAEGVDFSRNNNTIKEHTGYVIDTHNFREGDKITLNINYFLSDGTEKSFTKDITLENQKK